MDSFSKFTQNVSTSWSPFAAKVGRSLTQYKQLASEKLTTTAEVTELPSDYLELEQRFEAVRQTHQTLARLAKAYVAPPTTFDMQALQQQFTTLTTKIGGGKQTEEQMRAVKEAEEAAAAREASNTYQHAIARASLDVSEKVGLEEPLGAALFKFGSIEEKVGNEKIKQDKLVGTKFVQPLVDTLEGSIAMAQNARKQVGAARLSLDAAKGAFKNAHGDKVDGARREVEGAEDHFVTVVEEAMKLMRAVVESPENLRHLVAFVNAQLAFHRESSALLADLAPELEEILVTQEALYRHEQH
ncbi:BAR domain-containing protein [Coemansia erecta]|uniref:BAR domain-containing protein n=1 Tax=Coemansia asiatica TaxID=1052880 RepID=A0A9W8CJ82_9FUNG|nr:BAR domain-containing protein [Coemansia asiatica]KAJ2856784.1 BAR domain-containing protein [Coemansia erecta]KAJ2874335.1 BAR domain-containing protein [Coemansia asiatica]